MHVPRHPSMFTPFCFILYFVSSRRKVIRSFRSLAFFKPPKAIFVPGMYFLGFSRYSN